MWPLTCSQLASRLLGQQASMCCMGKHTLWATSAQPRLYLFRCCIAQLYTSCLSWKLFCLEAGCPAACNLSKASWCLYHVLLIFTSRLSAETCKSVVSCMSVHRTDCHGNLGTVRHSTCSCLSCQWVQQCWWPPTSFHAVSAVPCIVMAVVLGTTTYQTCPDRPCQ